jgi:hypothetical protein
MVKKGEKKIGVGEQLFGQPSPVLRAESVDLLRLAARWKREHPRVANRGERLTAPILEAAWDHLCGLRYCAAILELWDEGLVAITPDSVDDVRLDITDRGVVEGDRQEKLLEELPKQADVVISLDPKDEDESS